MGFNPAFKLLNIIQKNNGWSVVLTPEHLFQALACLGGIAGAQCGTGAVFPPSTSVFPCHYHSTIAPYLFRTNITL